MEKIVILIILISTLPVVIKMVKKSPEKQE